MVKKEEIDEIGDCDTCEKKTKLHQKKREKKLQRPKVGRHQG